MEADTAEDMTSITYQRVSCLLFVALILALLVFTYTTDWEPVSVLTVAPPIACKCRDNTTHEDRSDVCKNSYVISDDSTMTPLSEYQMELMRCTDSDVYSIEHRVSLEDVVSIASLYVVAIQSSTCLTGSSN